MQGWLGFMVINYIKIGALSIDLPLFYYRQHEESLSRDSDRLLKA